MTEGSSVNELLLKMQSGMGFVLFIDLINLQKVLIFSNIESSVTAMYRLKHLVEMTLHLDLNSAK